MLKRVSSNMVFLDSSDKGKSDKQEIIIDDSLNPESKNPVQNKAIYEALNKNIHLAADGDYTIEANLKNALLFSNTKNGFTTITFTATTNASIGTGGAKIVDISEKAIEVIGRTYFQTIGVCGSTLCIVEFNTYGGEHYIRLTPKSNVGTNQPFNMPLTTFPVTP